MLTLYSIAIVPFYVLSTMWFTNSYSLSLSLPGTRVTRLYVGNLIVIPYYNYSYYLYSILNMP